MRGEIDIDSLDKFVSLKFETEKNTFNGYELILPVKDPVWKAHAFLGLMCEMMEYKPRPKKSILNRIFNDLINLCG